MFRLVFFAWARSMAVPLFLILGVIMFHIAQKETYTAPVVVEMPGVKAKQTFNAEFKRLSQDEINALFGKVKSSEIDDKQFCRDVLAGWTGVNDADGELIFSAESLESVLNVYPLPAAIVQAYSESLTGARLKN